MGVGIAEWFRLSFGYMRFSEKWSFTQTGSYNHGRVVKNTITTKDIRFSLKKCLNTLSRYIQRYN